MLTQSTLQDPLCSIRKLSQIVMLGGGFETNSGFKDNLSRLVSFVLVVSHAMVAIKTGNVQFL